MARIRTIKPSFFVNEQLGELKPLSRLLFIGLWTLADRCGKIENRSKKIKAEVLPYDNARLDVLMDELETAGLIHRYQAKGRNIIQIINFSKHQRPHPKEPESELPDPEPCKDTAEPWKSSAEPWKKTEGCALREGKESQEHTHGGMGVKTRPNFTTDGPKDPQHWPEWFVAEWSTFYSGGTASQRNPDNVKSMVSELIRQKIPPEKIRDRIRDPSRDRNEPLFRFAEYFTPSGKGKKQQSTAELVGELEKFIQGGV